MEIERGCRVIFSEARFPEQDIPYRFKPIGSPRPKPTYDGEMYIVARVIDGRYDLADMKTLVTVRRGVWPGKLMHVGQDHSKCNKEI